MTRAIDSADFGERLADPIDQQRATVLFVGGPMRFSDRMLDVLNTEFASYRFIRVSTCADVATARRVRDDVVHVFFDESFLDQIRTDPARFDDAAGPARIGIAYCDARRAASFMSDMPGVGSHRDIGFLPLDAQIDVWVSVMRLLLCGHVFVPQTFCRTVPKTTDNDSVGLPVDVELTPREWEVLDWVAKGSPNKIIAAELGLSEHTIKLHIHNMLKKIGVTNRTGAANWYASCREALRAGSEA